MWLTYSRKLVRLPRPHFVVFSGGTESTPDHSVLKLSDAFEGAGSAGTPKDESKPLELVADVYNINSGRGSALLDACSTIKGYADFVQRIRENPHSQANAYEFDILLTQTIKLAPIFHIITAFDTICGYQ